MKEANYLFPKEGSLVEVPYVEPRFVEVLMLCPPIKRLTTYERMICNTFTCYVKYVLCCVQYEENEDVSYSYSMTFLILFGKVQLTWLSINHIFRTELFLIIYVLGVYLLTHILSPSVY